MKRGSTLLWGVAGAVGIGALLIMSNESEAAPAPRRKIVGKPIKVTAKRPNTLRSQLQGVTDEQWSKYVQAMGDTSNAHSISKTYHLGLFHFGMPRLADIGMATNVRKGDYQGRNVWLGDFVPPLTLDNFLTTPEIQYRALALSTGDFADAIASKYADSIKGGKLIVDGQRATPSGLLAVAHKAGLKGLGSWLAKSEDRKKYPNTTAAFKTANGVF